jgi:hypothetical protein
MAGAAFIPKVMDNLGRPTSAVSPGGVGMHGSYLVAA